MSPQAAFGRNVKLLRKHKGLSQGQLVEALEKRGLHLHRQTIQKIESDSRPLRFDEAVHIARVLGVELSEMLLEAAEYRKLRHLYQAHTELGLRENALKSAIRQVEAELRTLETAVGELADSDWETSLDERSKKNARALMNFAKAKTEAGLQGCIDKALDDLRSKKESGDASSP